MTEEWLAERFDETRRMSFGAFLVLVALIVCAGSSRRRAAGGIRLAAPTFVSLPPDAALGVADELGAALGVLFHAERRRGEDRP